MPRGTLFFVVGPSGAGKDTLIAAALAQRPDLYLMPRTITRPADDGEHEAVTPEEFAVLKRSNSFALQWDAHGLRYGISRDLNTRLEAGQSVVLNGSRSVVYDVRELYAPLKIIQVTAPLDMLSRRLRERGREEADDIEYRLGRAERGAARGRDVINIDNSRDLKDGVAAFLSALGDPADVSARYA